MSKRLRWYAVSCFKIREWHAKDEISIHYVCSTLNLSDIATKQLDMVAHGRLRSAIYGLTEWAFDSNTESKKCTAEELESSAEEG